jgi:single-strand DNA-binding protein
VPTGTGPATRLQEVAVPSTQKHAAEPSSSHVNEVHLVGRLAVEPVRRELPSGDPLVSFRLVVERPPAGRADRSATSRSPTVDTLDCAAWRRDVQRVLARAVAGEVLEVHGALRRRFWRAGGGPVSRSEVEVLRVRRRGPAG